MKSIISSILVSLITISLVYYYNPKVLSEAAILIEQPCSKPITYKIGEIDVRYGISKDELLKDLQQASDIWEKASGKKLYSYNPDGKLTVNLVYDERQALESQVSNIENQLLDKKGAITPSKEKYQNITADFKKKLADLNNEINEWNSKGGAPADIYEQLIQKQQDLKTQSEEINDLARKLNQSVQDYNLQLGELKEAAQDLNTTIKNKPEEGLFNPNNNEISIFLIVNKAELIHTLAHEFGHAIKLSHTIDPKSIMYPYTTTLIAASKEDIDAISAICNSTLLDRIRDKLRTLKFRIPS